MELFIRLAAFGGLGNLALECMVTAISLLIRVALGRVKYEEANDS